MTSSLVYANARCALGDKLSSAIDALLRGQCEPQVLPFTELSDPLTLPYYPLARSGSKPAGAEDIYCHLAELVEDALQQVPLSPAARSRTGVFLGSSSFDINVSEQRYSDALQAGAQAVPLPIIGYGKMSARLQQDFGFGPYCQTFSTACTSSANALLNAHRLLQAGIIDHALVIGVEMYNATTVLGFAGLNLISQGHMAPFEAGRDGLVLGEACALLLLSKDTAGPIAFVGGATATDNHSLTAANVDGSTVAAVMREALNRCQIQPEQLQAIKLHGTASLMNDEAEAAGVLRLAPSPPALFALKPYTGHTLGACGALETALTWGCLVRNQLPANPPRASEEDLGIHLLRRPQAAEPGYYALNFFAFGGNNSCLILRKDAA